METPTDIVVLEQRIAPDELRRLVERHFEDMVKYVVDVKQRIVAVGGELHADAEQALLTRGSRQRDIWGPITTRAGARMSVLNARP